MATLPTQVRPGDIISSDLLNAILEELAELRGTAVGGTQVVPNVFGMFLIDARATISQPSRQLALGFTLDVNGAAVDPLVPANQNLLVLNQSPAADARVVPGTPVNLVVAASGASAPAPAPAPTITGTRTPGDVATSTFPVGATMVIVGTNFSAIASQNTVRFPGSITAPSTPDPMDPTRRLQVVIPTGIPGAPVNTGDPPLINAIVSVQRTGNTATPTATITINPPLAAQPTVTAVAPLTQFEGLPITITGTNFTSTTQVFIRGSSATVTASSATSLTVTVPNTDATSGPPVGAPIRVVVPSNGETTFIGFSVVGV